MNPAFARPLRRLTTIELLSALVLLLVSFPFVEKLESGELIISILFTLVLVSALLAIEDRGFILWVSAAVAVAALTGRWINHYRPDLLPPELFLVGGIVFIVLVIISLLRFVLRAPSVDSEVLCASVAAYLLLGLFWTMAYWLVAELVPGAFLFNTPSAKGTSMKGFNSVYFSFITLSTVGYGDIVPVASTARMLAAIESNAGLLYVAVLIARLVSLYGISKPDPE